MRANQKRELIFLILLFAASSVSGALPGGHKGEGIVLGIFGNANMDDTIDEEDIAYVEGIIKGTFIPTNLSDANYDRKIDAEDIDQIERTIKGEDEELTLIDSAGRIVTVKKPVERIVAMNNEPAEIIRALRSEDKIVGVSAGIGDDKIFFPEFSDLAVVGSGSSPDYEKILATKPDILIYYAFWPDQVSALEEKLEPMGIKVICLDCFYPHTITQDVKKLSYILGKKDEANEFINWYVGYVDEIESRTEDLSDDEKPRVYLEGYNAWGTCSYGSPDDIICTIAGGINIARDLVGSAYSEYPTIDPEWVISKDPDAILCEVSQKSASNGYDEDDTSDMERFMAAVRSRQGLANLTALKEDKVYLISSDITREPEFVVAAAYLAKYLHPDLFKDLDPKAIHQEYLTRFQHLDYDLNEHGSFIYPPLEES